MQGGGLHSTCIAYPSGYTKIFVACTDELLSVIKRSLVWRMYAESGYYCCSNIQIVRVVLCTVSDSIIGIGPRCSPISRLRSIPQEV
ncbi:hypothetical protein LWI29_036975 [Acer saccharum]|uniref:Uncharacterized protein n=1 Tax=Acer saccharum TaxID=4024 RepID=A0AA39VAA6_ACESA|nr:hypothetical protein LWI29_036975 [Acer saccharum]KAK1551250.1 hypothetical protein Q3G72_032793 [Acer saccharum]